MISPCLTTPSRSKAKNGLSSREFKDLVEEWKLLEDGFAVIAGMNVEFEMRLCNCRVGIARRIGVDMVSGKRQER